MKYTLSPSFNDDKMDAPPTMVEVHDLAELADHIAEELGNDYGQPFGNGFTLTITRID